MEAFCNRNANRLTVLAYILTGLYLAALPISNVLALIIAIPVLIIATILYLDYQVEKIEVAELLKRRNLHP